MKEINKDIVFVQGFKNGAIYDFNTENIYSINDIACKIINKYVLLDKEYIDIEKEYLENLKDLNLISDDFIPREYIVENDKKIKLNMAWLELTHKCNLKCLHCYEGEEHLKEEEAISLEDWYRIIDQLTELDVNRIILIGGEPCCSPYVKPVIEYITKNSRIDVTLFTNATLISDELFKCIVDTKIRVKVSVYGHYSEIHDKITTVKNSFNKLVENVTRLVNSGIEVTASVVIMKENQDYVNEIVDFVNKLGMKYSRYDVIRNVYGGTQNEHTPDKKEVLRNTQYIKPNFSTNKERFNSQIYQNSCWYGKVAIMENGDVIPCEFERDIIYGSIKNETIEKILQSDIVYKSWFLNYSFIDTCKDCEFRYACQDCRALGKSVRGVLTDRNPRCQYDVYKGYWKEDI